MAGNASTSSSRGPVVLKILIDFAEYKQLLKAKDFLDKHNENVKKDLQTDQIGSGCSLEPSLANGIRDLIKSELQVLLHPAKEQTGGGEANDLPPADPVEEQVDDVAEPAAEELGTKSTPKSQFDDKLLLKSVPKQFKVKALKLIEALNKEAPSISWNSDGTLFIDDQSVPESNIYQIFPLLFKKSANKPPGYINFATKIFSLGLGDLIVHGSYVKRGLNSPEFLEDSKKIKISDNWWYLG